MYEKCCSYLSKFYQYLQVLLYKMFADDWPKVDKYYIYQRFVHRLSCMQDRIDDLRCHQSFSHLQKSLQAGICITIKGCHLAGSNCTCHSKKVSHCISREKTPNPSSVLWYVFLSEGSSIFIFYAKITYTASIGENNRFLDFPKTYFWRKYLPKSFSTEIHIHCTRF